MFRSTTVASSSFIATRRSLSRRALSFVTTNPPARSTAAALAIGAGGKQQSLLCPSFSAAPTAALFAAAATTARQPPRFYSTTTATMASVNDVLQSFTTPCVGTDVSLAMQSLADADCVCFDVDSTVINEEGIVSSHDYFMVCFYLLVAGSSSFECRQDTTDSRLTHNTVAFFSP